MPEPTLARPARMTDMHRHRMTVLRREADDLTRALVALADHAGQAERREARQAARDARLGALGEVDRRG